METSGVWEPLGPRERRGLEDESLLNEALSLVRDLHCESLETSQESSAPPPFAQVPGGFTSYVATGTTVSSSQLAKWPQLVHLSIATPNKCPKARRREEVLRLRDVVADLDRQLTTLRREAGSQYINPSLHHRVGAKEVAARLWKNVAVHQQAQRLEAERENAALKSLLHEQILVGKRLERLLHRTWPRAEVPGPRDSDVNRLESTNAFSSCCNITFDELATWCDALYADTDNVLSRLARAGVPRSVELVHDIGGVRVEFTTQCVFPFQFKEIASELWTMPPQMPSPPCMHRRNDQNHDGNTMQMHFNMLLRAGESRGEVSIKLVKRRYVEAHRIVIVYSALVEPLQISATNTDGIRIRHEGWQIIEPLESNPNGGSKLTEYHSSAPLVVNAAPEDLATNVIMLMEFVSSAVTVEFESHIMNLENRLIERSLRGSS